MFIHWSDKLRTYYFKYSSEFVAMGTSEMEPRDKHFSEHFVAAK